MIARDILPFVVEKLIVVVLRLNYRLPPLVMACQMKLLGIPNIANTVTIKFDDRECLIFCCFFKRNRRDSVGKLNCNGTSICIFYLHLCY